MVALTIMAAPATFTGCGTTGTHEAVVFHSFKDTWTAAHNAYAGFCESVVLGKVSKADEKRADDAWDAFRSAFKVSLRAASTDWSKATPADIQALSRQLIAIVRTL
jgi:hypothetical protein